MLSGELRSTKHIYKNTCRAGFATNLPFSLRKGAEETYQWEAKSQWRAEPLKGISAWRSHSFRHESAGPISTILISSRWVHSRGIVYEDDSQIADMHLRQAYDQ